MKYHFECKGVTTQGFDEMMRYSTFPKVEGRLSKPIYGFRLEDKELSKLKPMIDAFIEAWMDYRIYMEVTEDATMFYVRIQSVKDISREEGFNIVLSIVKKFGLNGFGVFDGGLESFDRNGDLVGFISAFDEFDD